VKYVPELIDYELNRAKSDSIYTICYTSGTTGLPKGAKIRQRNMIAEMCGIENSGYYYNREVTLFYLPLAHIMERINCLHSLLKGSCLGCISGDVKSSLLGDLQFLKPTIFVTVPRVLNLFKDLILQKVNELPNGFKKSMVLRAIQTKRENYKKNKSIKHTIFDTFILKKIRESLGGRVKGFAVGSAPLNKDTTDDMKVLFSVPIIEAYGMTECCGGIVSGHMTDLDNDSCGGCIWSGRFKLEDVPEMGYHSKTELNGKHSPTGEICIYGPLVFAGYFKNDKATKEAIDEEGWLHTGDIGRIMPDTLGLKIIDRKKEIFKLSQGEYIAPTKLEAIYSKSKFINQICIYGDSLHDFIIAVIGPNREAFEAWQTASSKAIETKIKTTEEHEFVEQNELENVLRNDLLLLAKENNLNGLERVNKIIISKTDFTIDNGCLTPTLKLVRRNIVAMVKDKIDEIYENK
jgi:long-chain acyl-CoA synthetase